MVMDHEPDEYELALRARDGDRKALAELVEQTRLRLFALAYAEVRHDEDAQDAVASALLQICLHVGELREPGRARAWMYRITRNEARLILRRRAGAVLRLEAEDDDRHAGFQQRAAAPSADASLLRLDIERALRQLPREEARAVALFYLAGLSVRDIAARLGRPEGTIKRWLHGGRRRLAFEMEGYAPMTPSTTAVTWAAAILSTDMEPAVLQSLVDAMKAAGWGDVATLGAGQVAERVVTGERAELHLTAQLLGK